MGKKRGVMMRLPDGYHEDGTPWFRPGPDEMSTSAIQSCRDCTRTISGSGGGSSQPIRCPKCYMKFLDWEGPE